MTFKMIPLLALALLYTESQAHAFGKKPVSDDQLDAEIQQIYPETGSVAQMAAACANLTEVAAARGVHTLIIGYEGLASFDSTGTHSAYRQHLQAIRGLAVEPFRAGGGGYLLKGSMLRLMTNPASGVEVIMFPHTATGSGDGSAPQACAEAWLKGRGNKLVISGHSYGGHAASQLVDSLARKNVAIDAVITVDPRLKGYIGNMSRPSSVAVWENYLQRNTPFLNGYSVTGADVNVSLSSTGVGHVGMPYAPAVRAAFDRILDSLK